MNSFSKSSVMGGPPDDWNMIIFDCSKENDFYNHAFHKRCLKKAIKEEVNKDKKASQRNIDYLKLSRCVVCYKHS